MIDSYQIINHSRALAAVLTLNEFSESCAPTPLRDLEPRCTQPFKAESAKRASEQR